MERVRRKLVSVDDGNRQMVDILTAVLTDGLLAVETACAEAIIQGVEPNAEITFWTFYLSPTFVSNCATNLLLKC